MIWIRDLMATWFEIKVRALLGPDEKDDKDGVILGRIVTWTETGIEYKADPKHRKMILEHFGMDGKSRCLIHTGGEDWKPDEDWEE